MSGLILVEVGGVLLAAVSGILEAGRKRLDFSGAFWVAMFTAFGGGTLRDLLLDRRPFFWVDHWSYALLILGMSLLLFTKPALHALFEIETVRRVAFVFDAFAQLVPRLEAVFTRDDRLRVMQGERTAREIRVGTPRERR